MDYYNYRLSRFRYGLFFIFKKLIYCAFDFIISLATCTAVQLKAKFNESAFQYTEHIPRATLLHVPLYYTIDSVDYLSILSMTILSMLLV